MVKRIALIVLAFAVVTAVIFTGCTPARKPMNTDQYKGTGLNGTANNQNDPALTNNWGTRDLSYNNGYGNEARNNRMGSNVNLKASQKTDNLESACEQVQGVKDATVVVTANTAYVGIELDKNANITNERDIKNEVTQKIRTSNQNITTVYVSTEVDFMDRLRNVGKGIKGGRPNESFTNELRDMIRKITPTNW